MRKLINAMKGVKEIGSLMSGEKRKKIKNFENNIKPELCEPCQKYLQQAMWRNNNIITMAAKKEKFCAICADIIAQRASELYVEDAK